MSYRSVRILTFFLDVYMNDETKIVIGRLIKDGDREEVIDGAIEIWGLAFLNRLRLDEEVINLY